MGVEEDIRGYTRSKRLHQKGEKDKPERSITNDDCDAGNNVICWRDTKKTKFFYGITFDSSIEEVIEETLEKKISKRGKEKFGVDGIEKIEYKNGNTRVVEVTGLNKEDAYT